jgi:hypothetical protein
VPSNGESSYLNQVDASAHKARERVERARRSEDSALQARLLSQAVEWGIRAVLTSWDAPVAKPDKLWSAFDDPIAGLLDPEVTTWAQQVRAVRPVLAATLLSAAGANLEAIIRLAQNNPPTGSCPPERSSLGWNGLPADAREFLATALSSARIFVPDAELWLFGSRATGTNRDDSDFDLLLILPDSVSENLAGQAMGQVWQTAQTRGHFVDHQKIAAATWSEPDVVNTPLVNEVKRFGVRVP